MLKRCYFAATLLLLFGCNGSDDVQVTSGPSPLMITVSWTAPDKYVDGTPLPASAIAGYRIAYGTSPTAMNTTIDVPASPTSKQLGSLEAATYYVTVRTRGTNGEVSAPAGPASGVSHL